MDKIRCGVIGVGWWATHAHLPALRCDPRAEIVAVQSRDQVKADKVASTFGAKHACTSVEELLALEELDAVIIATTPNVHHAQAKAALERGLHVLVEKPMTLTAAEARELVELAESRRVQLLISCPWHFTAHGREAQRLIRSGVLGEVKMISVLMTNPVEKLLRGTNTIPTHAAGEVSFQPRPGSYNDPSVAGGGQIYCQVSHAAAYLEFLTGHRANQVFAHFDFDNSPNDIYNALAIKLGNGALVSLASTGATPESERTYEVRIYGSKGIIFLELWKGTMTFIDTENQRTDYPPLASAEIYPDRAPAHNLIDAVLDPTKNKSPGTLGLTSMEIIEAACESARTGHNIFIP